MIDKFIKQIDKERKNIIYHLNLSPNRSTDDDDDDDDEKILFVKISRKIYMMSI